MNSETLLEVRGLYKSYSEVKVLNDVSLSVGKGSITGLIGENGAGKSTLIKCINGVTRPDSGEIIFQGRALKHITIESALRLGIVTIPQELFFSDMNSNAAFFFWIMPPCGDGRANCWSVLKAEFPLMRRSGL